MNTTATPTAIRPGSLMDAVARRCSSFHAELCPSGEVGRALVRLAATMSVRMEMCLEYEDAVQAERTRRAEADFAPPQGVGPAEAARLRTEAGRRALFDPSPEASLARRHEAAAQRVFLRALKELRTVEREAESFVPSVVEGPLGSFSLAELSDQELDDLEAAFAAKAAERPAPKPLPTDFASPGAGFDLPFTIGKRR